MMIEPSLGLLVSLFVTIDPFADAAAHWAVVAALFAAATC